MELRPRASIARIGGLDLPDHLMLHRRSVRPRDALVGRPGSAQTISGWFELTRGASRESVS